MTNSMKHTIIVLIGSEHLVVAKHVIIALLFLSLWGALPGGYSAERSGRYTIEALVRMAESNHLPLEIKKTEIAAKKELSLQEKQWENPEAGVSLGGKKTGAETGMEYSVTLSQKIPISGKKGVSAAIANLEEREARIALEEARLALRYEITRLAYAYARDMEKMKHIQERLKRIKLVNAHMQGHLLVAPQRIVERNIVREKLARMEMELLEIRKSVTVSYNALNHYLKLPADGSFTVDLAWFPRAPDLNLDELLSLAMNDNFTIRYHEGAVARAEKSVSLAKRDVMPDIGLNIYYGGDTLKEKEQTFGGGITMPLPILSQNRHGIEKESSNLKSRRIALLHARDTVKRAMAERYAEFKYAGGMVALFPVSRLDALEKKMDYADDEFRKGRVTLSTYLEMDYTLHESIESVFESQLLLVGAYTELLFMAAVKKEINGGR